MFLRLFLLFTLVPCVELALLIKLGTVIGALDTIVLVILTGVVGALAVRAAGIQCLFRIQENLRARSVPAEDLFNGVLILLSGALLITPGLITDAVGFSLLFPPTRDFFKKHIKHYLSSRISSPHDRYRP